MATANMKAPAAQVGAFVKGQWGNFGPVPASRVLAVDTRYIAGLMAAGWQDPGIIPTGGASGDDLNKASTADFDLSWAA